MPLSFILSPPLQSSLGLPGSQVLALFNKAVRKLHAVLQLAAAHTIEAAMPRVTHKEVGGRLAGGMGGEVRG